MYSLTQHPFSKIYYSSFSGVCLSPCGTHTGPQNVYCEVESVLSIIVAKSIIIYTPNNNKVQQLSRNKFSWLMTQLLNGVVSTFMPTQSIPCSQWAKGAPPAPPDLSFEIQFAIHRTIGWFLWLIWSFSGIP